MRNLKMPSKPYSDIKVLIYGAGGRQALPVIKGFSEQGCMVTAYCGSRFGTGYLSKYSKSKILYNRTNNKNLSFYEYGERYILSGQYDIVVPLGDEGATYLSINKERLSRYAKIAVNDWPVFQKVIDKSLTMQICNDNGIPAPITLLPDDPIKEIDEGKIGFPVVVKPKTGVGSIGFNIIRDRKTLASYLSEYDNSNGPILIQEYIEQGNAPQYRVDLFRDRNGMYKAAIAGKVTRWYPLDGGSGIYAETIHEDEMVSDCKKLLDAIGWVGYANVDLVWDSRENRAKILEINGRTGATIMLDYVAGINISQLIIENELGMPVTDMNSYPDGKAVSCLLPDILWFLKSKQRFTTTPSWFRRWGAKDTVFSWDDPLPTIGFLLSSIAGFRKSMKLRKRIK